MKFFFRQTNRPNWHKIFEELKSNIWLLGHDKDLEIELRPMRKKPTMNQRGYYFSVILPSINNFLKNEGNYYGSLDKLHDDIKGAIQDRFGLYVEVTNNLTGEVEKRPISLSDSKGDRENVRKYIDAVLIWSAEMGLVIPDPYIKFNDK